MQPEQAFSNRVALAGSERKPVEQARDCGPVDAGEEANVTVHLRSRTPEDEFLKMVGELSAKPIAERKYLSRDELAQLRGANPEDLARIEEFAKQHGLTVTGADPSSRTITLHGTLGSLQQAFGTELRCYNNAGTQFRARTGPLYLPNEIAASVTGVFGLDTRPAAAPREQ